MRSWGPSGVCIDLIAIQGAPRTLSRPLLFIYCVDAQVHSDVDVTICCGEVLWAGGMLRLRVQALFC